jgi:Zn-dependent peptidase ImmA (M78 family)
MIRLADMPRGPEISADELLSASWADDCGHIVLPVEPSVIAEKLGLKHYVADLGQAFAGMLVGRAASEAEIHVNREHGKARQRFTGAHELGHYVLRCRDEDSLGEDWGDVALRPESETGNDPAEIWANRFAAALLMPRRLVEELRVEFPELAILAAKFGVSPKAMSFRLRYLDS